MESPRAKVIGIELTERCNFACVHCYLERKISPKLTLESIGTLAESAEQFGFNTVYITGGEPTLHPLFVDTYRLFRGRGYLTSVYTNGSFLSEPILNAFEEMSPRNVEITLYGMSEDTYEAVTGRRQFEVVMSNVRELIRREIPVFLKYNILTVNQKDFPSFLEFCQSNGLHYSINAQIIPMNNGDLSPIQYRLPPAEVARIGDEFGIDFAPNGDGYDRCDVGENLFVDSQGRIRGCPVLFSGVDQQLFSGKPIDFEDIERLFRRLRENKAGKYCPAWTATEGQDAVGEYLEELKVRAERSKADIQPST